MRGYNIDDFVGKKFNNLTLIKNMNKIDKHNSKLALFKCDCGNVKELVFTQVLHNKVQSCGCKQGNLTAISKQNKKESSLNFYMNKTQRNNTTGINGISNANGKYRVRIQVNKKPIHLGYFDTLDKAIKARKEAEEKYFKPIIENTRARIN